MAELSDRKARAVAAISLGWRGSAAFAYWDAAADARFADGLREGAAAYLRHRSSYGPAELLVRVLWERVPRRSTDAAMAIERIRVLVAEQLPRVYPAAYLGAGVTAAEVLAGLSPSRAWRAEMRYAVSLAPSRRCWRLGMRPAFRSIRYAAAARVGYRAATGAGAAPALAAAAALDAMTRLAGHPAADQHAAAIRRDVAAAPPGLARLCRPPSAPERRAPRSSASS